jgi:hypothetical protein
MVLPWADNKSQSHIMKDRVNMKRLLWVSPVVVLASLIALAPSASAAVQVFEAHATVSCDRNITTSLVKLSALGTTTFGQYTATSPGITSTVWGTSLEGNDLPAKNVSNGGTIGWTQVAWSDYMWKTHVASSTNCNSILPGYGNSNLSYIIRH